MLTEPVSFFSEGLKILAVLGRPSGQGKFPAFIDTHGAMSRGGDMGPSWTDMGTGSYRETLVESGYAVLRVARRGYCGSEGKSLPAYAIRQVDGYRPWTLCPRSLQTTTVSAKALRYSTSAGASLGAAVV